MSNDFNMPGIVLLQA